MPASASPRPPAAVVATLRAAGCVFAEDEARLLASAAGSAGDLAALVQRRAAGEPLEYVLGWASFCGLRITVEPGVFVPRRRTELLVHHATVLARRGAGPTGPARPVVVDLCCGSGAVGAALATALGRVELYAVDIDPAAVRCARRNLPDHARVYEGDLYQPLPESLRGRADILVANAPYVPTGSVGLLPREARLHEARVALDGGVDGLDVLRRVIAAAPRWLAAGGHLLVEASEAQAPRLIEAVAAGGLVAWSETSDELNATIVVVGRAGQAAGRLR